MANEKTEKYIVIQTNTLDHKVGDVISLTESKAKFLVGKVEKQPKRQTKAKQE